MVRKLEMTWQASTKRWFKKHKGTMYTVSCRQLNCLPTKEESAAAANEWWEAKIRQLEAAPPTERDIRGNAAKVWAMVQEWGSLDEESRQKLVDSLIGAGQYDKLKTQAANVVASTMLATPPERTVQAQVNAWQNLLRGICVSGQMSEGRFDGYCRNIGKFAAWIGPESAVDAIDEAKLEEFFNHLSSKIGEGKYSPNYAHTLLMTAKQFISRLAELKLIPLPGNIRSRRFRFNHSVATKIETFTLAEVRALLMACDGFSERTKLYILLMLGCGMYQNDLAELRNEEVDWKVGTITRARSKTRKAGGPTITYKLWPETFTLLKKYRAEGDLALTTDEGKPLVRLWLEPGAAKVRRYDCIHSAWTRLAAKMGMAKIRLGIKHLRKTSATLLGQHHQFKYFAGHFLADSPKGMDQKHYVLPSQDEFFLALDWLRDQILGTENSQLASKSFLHQQA